MAHVDILTGANGRLGRIALPWLEVLYVFQSRGGLDPFQDLRDSDNPHITHGNLVLEKLMHSYNAGNGETKGKKRIREEESWAYFL